MRKKVLSAGKGTTGSLGSKESLDKFYTNPKIAEFCLNRLGSIERFSEVIEPSAGAGSFSNLLESCTAFDIAPEHDSIVQQDWFQYERARGYDERVLVVGNPPFGKRNSLALRFINHAAVFADTVAFVLPLSFMKDSVQARVHQNLHLVDSVQLPKNSFLLRNKPYDVPCVFQVWEWREELRAHPVKLIPAGFSFVRKDAFPDLYIQRIGGNAGASGVFHEGRSKESNYFVKLDEGEGSSALLSALRESNYDARLLSVGPKSLSQQEILKALRDVAPQYVRVCSSCELKSG